MREIVVSFVLIHCGNDNDDDDTDHYLSQEA